MNKITGNEPANPKVSSCQGEYGTEIYSSDGIPIRLHIAAMIMQSLSHKPNYSDISFGERANDSILMADILIETYNNTPNPNE